ncbi:MAG: glycosyltransferase family 9 protein [Candidatus Zixiibacteriota bacterium]
MPEIDLQSGDRLLICRTDRLGDLVLALPFVETLKARYPDCPVDVMASLYASPILENNPGIDRIVRVQNDQLVSSRNYRKELEQRVKKGNYKAAVLLYPERQISRLLYRMGVPVRIGTAGRFHSVFFTHRLLHSRKSNKKHEAEYNLDFLEYFRPGRTITHPTVYPTAKELKNARRILEMRGIDTPFMVIHPGSGGSAERWPMRRFLELYAALNRRGHTVVITGSDSEGKAVRELAVEMGIAIKELTGQTDLRTLAAVLSLASTVIANSTGPLHLAVAVGTRVVGLYPGRQIMSPVRWGPIGEGHRVMQPESDPCRCPAGQCRCMETITAEQVAEAAGAVYDGAVRK